MDNRQPIITLLTDFGTQDYFVGAMKGVILSINPSANVVDISHDIPPQDIEAAAFNLFCCYRDFPAGTIHVAVVDPGVGSDRKPLAISCARQFFVGPDNGIFSWICDREQQWEAFQLTNSDFFRQPPSHTFHGRDIFAPIAAELSKGAGISELGKPLQSIVRLEPLAPKRLDNSLEGRLIHIDRFGNCITNFRSADLLSEGATSWRLLVKGKEVSQFLEFFAQDQTADIFCVVGSAGFLELVARNRSAAELLNVQRGERLVLAAASLKSVQARLD
jgi:S-adenosylmethionine hydrolase